MSPLMSKETLVFISGILLTVIPFMGIPHAWRQYTVFGIGIVLILSSYILRRRVYLHRFDKGNGECGTDSFVETTEKLFDEGAIE